MFLGILWIILMVLGLVDLFLWSLVPWEIRLRYKWCNYPYTGFVLIVIYIIEKRKNKKDKNENY